MRPPQGDTPPHTLPLCCLLRAPRGPGLKQRLPFLRRIPETPRPYNEEKGDRKVARASQRAGTLSSLPPPLHTPKGKGGDSCRCLPHFSFPCPPEQRARHPHWLPHQNPATDTGTSSGAGAAEPRDFQPRSPEKTGRGREAEGSWRGESGPCPAFPAQREAKCANKWQSQKEPIRVGEGKGIPEGSWLGCPQERPGPESLGHQSILQIIVRTMMSR